MPGRGRGGRSAAGAAGAAPEPWRVAGRRRRAAPSRSRCRGAARRRPGRRPAAGPLALDVVRDVLAGDPPATAGADDLGGGRGRARGAGGGPPGSSGRPGRRRVGRRGGAAVGGGRMRAPRRRARGRSSDPAGPSAGGERGRSARRPGSSAPARPSARLAGAAPARPRPAAGGAVARRRGASSAVSMTAISALFGTVAPSSTRISLRMPSNGDGTSALTLSVMTSSSGSYLSTWSPGCFSHLPIVPSATLSPSWGIVTLATVILRVARRLGPPFVACFGTVSRIGCRAVARTPAADGGLVDPA